MLKAQDADISALPGQTSRSCGQRFRARSRPRDPRPSIQPPIRRAACTARAQRTARVCSRPPSRDRSMANKMLIDTTHPEETRVVVLRGNRVEEFDFESANRRQLRGNIYLAKVTRVEPSLQAAFVDYGGNRHGFLAFFGNPSRLLSDPGRRPAGADRRGRARASRRRGRDRPARRPPRPRHESHGRRDENRTQPWWKARRARTARRAEEPAAVEDATAEHHAQLGRRARQSKRAGPSESPAPRPDMHQAEPPAPSRRTDDRRSPSRRSHAAHDEAASQPPTHARAEAAGNRRDCGSTAVHLREPRSRARVERQWRSPRRQHHRDRRAGPTPRTAKRKSSNPSAAPTRWKRCRSARRATAAPTRSKKSSSAGRSCWCRW